MLECLNVELDLIYRRTLMEKFEKNGWLKYQDTLDTLTYDTKERKWKSKVIDKEEKAHVAV